MLSIKATLGGTEYDLPVLTPAVRDRLQAWYDNGGFEELINPDAGLIGTDDDEPRCRVGSVIWPVVGATRFARAVLPIDAYTLGRLRGDLGSLVAEADGAPLLDEAGDPLLADSRVAVTLSFRDDPTDAAEVPRTVDMFVIASRPVSRTQDGALPTTEPAEDDLWLVTLVDERYFWVHAQGSGLPEWWDASAPAYTWADVFATLFARVDSAYTMDAADLAYTDPTERWGCKSAQAASAAFLLDYAALCVGSRIVKVPGQTPAVQRPLAAYRTLVTTWHADQVADDRFSGGGLLDSDEMLGGVPGAVHGSFQDGTAVEVFLATGETGRPIEAWHDCAAWRPSGTKTAQVTQWAADWYTWQDAPLDALYGGFVLPPLSGYLGSVEWYHDSVVGYTRVQRPWQGWVDPPDWRPDSFPAVLTSTYGGTGYEWSRDVQKKLSLGSRGVTGKYAVEINGRTDLQPGLAVEMFAECFGCGVSFEYNPPGAGCNLIYDNVNNKYKVDVPSLAGTGLVAVLGGGGCYSLAVDAGYMPPSVTIFGCGLDAATVPGTLSVNLTGVVTDPLTWSGCLLGLNIACGLMVTPGGFLQVNTANLVGDRAESSLVDGVLGGSGCDIGVDLTRSYSLSYEVVNDVNLYRTTGGLLQLSVTKLTLTDNYNEAGLLLNTDISLPFVDQTYVNICDTACCTDCVPTATITSPATDSTYTLSGGSVTVNFTATASGCTGPYTYNWDFGDSGSTTTTSANTSHTYTRGGSFTVRLVVADACGRASAEEMIVVNVNAVATYDCSTFAGQDVTWTQTGCSGLPASGGAGPVAGFPTTYGATTSCGDPDPGTGLQGWQFTLDCSGGVVTYSVTDGFGHTYTGTVAVTQAVPFQGSFTYTAGTGSCCPGTDVTVTLTGS